MAEIIQKWLLNRIGVNVPILPEVIGEICSDGTMFAKILHKYNICSHEYMKMILRTEKYEVAYANLKKLCVWLKLLGIPYNDLQLSQIASRKGSPALRLLYELFIRLESKEELQQVDWQRKEVLLSESTELFDVQRGQELKCESYVQNEKEYLRESYEAGKEIIKKLSSKEKPLIERRIDNLKKKLEMYKAQTKLKESSPKLPSKTLPADKSNGKDANEFKKIMEEYDSRIRAPCVKEDIIDCRLGGYASLLKVKRREAKYEEMLKQTFEGETLDEAWKCLLLEKEEIARDILAKKLLKHSDQEKQMIHRLKRCRFRYKRMIDNRRMISDLVAKQKYLVDFNHLYRVDTQTNSEKARLMQLHKHLFQIKKNQRYQTEYRACRNILYDIIDLVLLYQDYQEKYNEEPPSKTIVAWKVLFLKGLPILHFPQGENLNYAGVISNKVEDVLANLDFYRYINLLGPWNPTDFTDQELGQERLDFVGYLVHNLLDMKYTFDLAKGKPADMPDHKLRLLLRPVGNVVVIEKLKDLLKKAKVAVVEVNTAVSYVIDAYDKFMNENDSHKKIVPMKTDYRKMSKTANEGRNKRKWLAKERISMDTLIATDTDVRTKGNNVGVQFPEDPAAKYSLESRGVEESAVSLGRILSSYLADGLPMSDVLTCRTLVEYMKSLTGSTGWVLVDYPRTLVQAAILEFMFSGREVPFAKNFDYNLWYQIKKELEDLGFEEKANGDEIEEVKNDTERESEPNAKEGNKNIEQISREELEKLKHPRMREIVCWKRSEIVPKLYPDEPLPLFRSLFTNVINIKCISSRTDECSMNFSPAPDDEETNANNEKIDGSIEDFYFGIGIAVTFNYDTFSPQVLMNLASVILNNSVYEGDPDWTNAVDLFGFDTLIQVKPKRFRDTTDTPYTIHDKSIICDLLQGPVYKQPSLEDLSRELDRQEDEGVASVKTPPSDLEKSATPNDDNKFLQTLSNKGMFLNLYGIPNEYYSPLASVWETMEFFYKFNLNEIFNLLRKIESQTLPYRNHVYKVSKECVELSDDRHILVSNFQLMLNGISESQRSITLVKNELHCRVFELQCKLWKIADSKKYLSEYSLSCVKEQKWLPRSVTNFIKAYTCMFQSEVDRFVDTMQLVIDYLSLMLTNHISTKRLSKIIMPKFDWSRPPTLGRQMSRESIRSYKSTKIKQKHLSQKGIDLTKDLSGHYKKLLLPVNIFEEPVHLYCEDFMTDGSAGILGVFNVFTEALIINVEACKELGKSIVEDLYEPDRAKDKTSRSFTKTQTLTTDFSYAINKELERVVFRIKLIRAQATKTIKHQISVIEKAFEDFKRDIIQQYHVELMNIERLYDLFRAAIEEEVRIQPAVRLTTAALFVDPSRLAFPCPPPPPPSRLVERTLGWRFTISQLENLAERLSSFAPFGFKKTILTAVLQDMALTGHELGHPYLPPGWSRLTDSQISQHVDRWFGDKAFVFWKELVVFGLDLGYPKLEEVLDMRRQFVKFDPDDLEVVSRQNYMDVELWFDKAHALGLRGDLRRAKAKDLIFKLFQADSESVNYTALLLAFSRDEDPVAGFVKALAAVEGSVAVAFKSELFWEEEQIAKENEKFEIVGWILNEIIFNVWKVHDVIIEDYIEEVEVADLLEGLVGNEEDTLPVNPKNKSVESEKSTNKVVADIYNDGIVEKPIPGRELLVQPHPNSGNLPISHIKHRFLWKSDVHLQTVLSIILFCLSYNDVSLDQLNEQLDIKERLTEIFNEKGNGYSMKFYTLLEHSYTKRLLSSYRLFQGISITKSMSVSCKTDKELHQECTFK